MTTPTKSEIAVITPASSPARSVISASSQKSQKSLVSSSSQPQPSFLKKHGLNIAIALSITALLVSFYVWNSKSDTNLEKRLESLEETSDSNQKSLQQLKGDVEMLKNER